MARSLPASGDSWQRLGLALMLFGLGSKLGLAPLYSWLPETYEAAPTSTSALLAAVQFNISIVAPCCACCRCSAARTPASSRTSC
jgi:hydrogenase-4 component F